MATYKTHDGLELCKWTDLLTGAQIEAYFSNLIDFSPLIGLDQKRQFGLASFNELKTMATQAWYDNEGMEFMLARSIAVEKFGKDPFRRAA